MSERGKFIVIEGGEGSGKSTCIEELKKENIGNSIFTREPGGTEVGEEIRAILMDKSNHITTLAELFLFCAVRAEHCAKVIRPALKNGVNVICDRFSPSTFAYQIIGAQREGYKTIFDELNYIATNNLKPDLIIYLDVDPAIGLERRKNAGEITRFDVKDIMFHQRVRSGFLKLAGQNGNWITVDASRDEDVVQKDVVCAVRNFLYEGRV
ncbi:dTMP kinase [Patescibacteria group bacterium]|nr:dTMP kinase [Patescibacteria group bacterium]MBU4353243.1 dTMP kinase [Patescibacteria group bacterium]MBU4477139.1 dTMP kinase [Patescibacteria group bacterium]MCG2698932.1 dTMP kinase [Candidatus Parcubacteria bacterium]